MKNKNRLDASLAIIAALLVLFSAMINPVYSVIISILFFIGFGIYKFLINPKQ
jgi:hypothetical protein